MLIIVIHVENYLQDLPRLEEQRSRPAGFSSPTGRSFSQWFPRSRSPSPPYSHLRSQSHPLHLHLLLLLSTDYWRLRASAHFVRLGQRWARFQSHLIAKSSFAWRKSNVQEDCKYATYIQMYLKTNKAGPINNRRMICLCRASQRANLSIWYSYVWSMPCIGKG